MPQLPLQLSNSDQLDELLSEPTPAVMNALGNLDGDILILGVGGKMGPTLARMAVRAFQQAGVKRRVIGVARFSNPELPAWLQKHGVQPLTADLLDPQQIATLPDAENGVEVAGLKVGFGGLPGHHWA